MSNIELLPCPFCGGEAKTSRGLHKYDCWGIWCPTCGVRTDLYPSEREAIEAWNTRYERTCKNISRNDDFVCSECGADVFAVTYNENADVCVYQNNKNVGIRFCPACGFKVVD